MSTSIKRKISSTAAAAAIFVGAFAVTAEPAFAVGGNCRGDQQHQSVTGLDKYRTAASCSALQGDSKAQGTLIRNAGPDYYSSWFTTLNKYYYTGWYDCYAGCSSSYTVAHV